ncbi:epidermal growth factor receptor substrate 15-like 1 isoform X1 [Sycon ciliatum]|uniref:epidermal growth factor receptor substrate 15-like 1 isoform X1 n=2 Tax=Sycon ciliatum TaxID=27933 RepID=UPI0031F6F91F
MAAAALTATQVAGAFLSHYEALWRQADSSGAGIIPANEAVAILKRSKLPEAALHSIWSVADYHTRGSLDKQGFFIALRLIAAAQAGIQPNVGVLTMTATAPPSLEGMSGMVGSGTPSGGLSSSGTPVGNGLSMGGNSTATFISQTDMKKYESIFESLLPENGRVAGDKVKPVLMNSKLPVNVLGQIWELADSNRDGFLFLEDFCVCMHLTYRSLDGDAVPNTVPVQLRNQLATNKIQSARSRSASIVSAHMLSTSASGLSSPLAVASAANSGSLLQPAGATLSSSSPTWIVSGEEQKLFEGMFRQADKEGKNFVSGDDVRSLFVSTGLPGNLLAHIWGLCDMTNCGRLTLEQFMLAMYLAKQKKISNVDPPQKLTPDMIPPSMRSQSTGIGGTQSEGPSPDHIAKNEELKSLSEEISQLNIEKEQCTEEVTKKQGQLNTCRDDVQGLQQEVSQAQHQLKSLEKQREDLTMSLMNVEKELSEYEAELAGLKEKCRSEENQISNLKSQLDNQQSTMQSQQEELRQAKDEMSKLLQEEEQMKTEVSEGRSVLSNLELSVQAAKTESSQIRGRIGQLSDVQQSFSAQVQQAQLTSSESPLSGPDPFQMSSPSADPFKAADPFAKSDPFSSRNDPFKLAATNSSDPFGSSTTSAFSNNQDPFGSATTSSGTDLGSSVAPAGGMDGGGNSSARRSSFSTSTAPAAATPSDLFSNSTSSNIPRVRSGTVGSAAAAGAAGSSLFGSSTPADLFSTSSTATDGFSATAMASSSSPSKSNDPFASTATSSAFDQFSSTPSTVGQTAGNDLFGSSFSPETSSTASTGGISASGGFPSGDPFAARPSASTGASTAPAITAPSTDGGAFDSTGVFDTSGFDAFSTTSSGPATKPSSSSGSTNATTTAASSSLFGDSFGSSTKPAAQSSTSVDPFAAFGQSDPFATSNTTTLAPVATSAASGSVKSASPFGDDPFGAGGF